MRRRAGTRRLARRWCAVRWQLAFFLMLIGALASTPARALNHDDYAAMMGMLWRLQEPIWPSISFDPATVVQAMKLPGGNPSTVRSRHRDAFARGYAVSTDWLSQGTTAEYCKEIANWFDGKYNLDGTVKDTPEPPVPGLSYPLIFSRAKMQLEVGASLRRFSSDES